MGLSLSLVLVQNTQHETNEALLRKLRSYMEAEGYCESGPEDADIMLRMQFPGQGQWFALGPDEENTDDSSRARHIASRAFAAPVMAAQLVDSDFLLLTLYDADGHKSGHVTLGEPYWDRDNENYDAFAAVSPEGCTADRIQELCEQDRVFAEDGFIPFGTLMDIDPSVLWTEWEQADQTVYFRKEQKVRKPQLKQAESLYGIYIKKNDSLSADMIMEQMDQVAENSMLGNRLKRSDHETEYCVRLLETSTHWIIRSDIIPPAEAAKRLDTGLLAITITDQIVVTAILGADGFISGQLTAPAENFDLTEFAESYGTTAADLRMLNKDGEGCVNLYYEMMSAESETLQSITDLPEAMQHMSRLTVLSANPGDKFAYLFQNPMQLSLAQILEKLETGLAEAYGPMTFRFQRYNPKKNDYEPCVYEYAGGICRTDAENAEADLRVTVTESGFALSGSLCLPEGKHYAAVMQQNCMELYLDAKNEFAELRLIAPDNSTLNVNMADLNDYADFCAKNGFDAALFEAVCAEDAAVFYYRRPDERSNHS